MPFFIPLILMGVGAASGCGGIFLGGKGAYELKRATDKCVDGRRRYEKRHADAEAKRTKTNESLKALGERQQRAILDVVVRMQEFLRRNERQVRGGRRLLADGIEAPIGAVPEPGPLGAAAATWISGLLGSATAGVRTAAGVTAAAGSLGVASTGTAIGTLSGAAAESATLAFLGGGSLASGGGGIALGATALNVVTAGPALLAGGFVIKGQGTKALTQAREYEATVAVRIAELDETDVRLDGIAQRAAELEDLLTSLSARATAALDVLEQEPFDPHAHASRFQHAMTLVMAVRDVASTPIVDDDGHLTDQSGSVTVTYRDMPTDTPEETAGVH